MADARARLYREIVVWREPRDGVAVRYTCFEDLETGLFCVQVADMHRLPLDDTRAAWQARNRVELLLEGQLEACDWWPNLTAAIAAHDEVFS